MQHRMWVRIGMALVAGLILAAPVSAQRDLTKIPPPDPEQERRSFRLPEGFEVNLFAGDPALAKPIQMSFDPEGRLWIATSRVYPHIEPGQAAEDQILVLEDCDQDGVADRTTVFADGLLIPTGVLPGDGGAYVANSTELLFLPDADGDLRADSRRVLLSGFGTEDTHHILHTLRWGPDGHLYMNQSIYIHSHIETPWGVRRLNGGGIWQFRPETRELGVFMRGLINSWGHVIDPFGQSFATDGAGGEGINYVVPGAYYATASNAPRILRGLNPGSPKHCGLEIVDTPALPPDWQGSLLTNDFRGHRVCRFRIVEDRSGYISREQQEVIVSDHVAFRPVDICIGPDGAIYIADWYNPIIQHGEVDFRDPRRDHSHGRIWRVTWTGSRAARISSPRHLPNAEVFERFRSDSLSERRAAHRILKERGSDVADDLDQWLAGLPSDASADRLRLEALWCFQALRAVRTDLLRQLLKADDGRIRAATVRVLSHWKHFMPDADALLEQAVSDEHPRVRLEAVRALSFSPLEDSEKQAVFLNAAHSSAGSAAELPGAADPQRVLTALKILDRPVDRFLRYGLFLTIRELSDTWLPAFRAGQLTFANVRQLTTAFDAVGQAPPAALLIGRVYHDETPDGDRHQLVDIIAATADASQFSQLAEAAAEHRDADSLLRLQRHSRRRGIRAVCGPLLVNAIDADDVRLQAAALRLAAQWDGAGQAERLLQILSDGTEPAVLREAALEAVRLSQVPDLYGMLAQAARSSDNRSSLRRKAAALLMEVDVPAGTDVAVELLRELPPSDGAWQLVRGFLSGSDGPDRLARALSDVTIPAETARHMLKIVRQSGRRLPELEQAISRAGRVTSRVAMSEEDVQRLLARAAEQGSAERGEQVFRRRSLGCLKCHAIGGAGGRVGPDLISVGASAQPDYLLESLLKPNAKVKENYHTVVVVTDEGRVVSGILVRESENSVVLRDADNRLRTISREEIEERTSGVSLMPKGLVDDLTDADLADLVRFLSELGRTPAWTVGRERVLRSWSVLKDTPQARHILRRTRIGTAATDRSEFQWETVISRVSGSLPLEEIPLVPRGGGRGSKEGFGIARTHVRVETPGTLVLASESDNGLQLYAGERPVSWDQGRWEIPVQPGILRVTLIAHRPRRREPIRLQISDDGTTAVVSPVNEPVNEGM